MIAGLNLVSESTIVALSTPPGTGALAVLRVSGPATFAIMQQVFRGRSLEDAAGNTIRYGHLVDGDDVVDEVLVSVFKAPHSYTKEDSVEISCHGSPLIVQQAMNLFLSKGALLAQPGEFTLRAFRNGRFDLAQAEAVADLIHAETDAAKQMAMNQMRGGFSQKLAQLRERLIHFASLIELELDFSEEDVEFASRTDLKELLDYLLKEISQLVESFKLGNVLKHGIPVVIAGKPNAGKSTLLNQLLQEEKALVSDIPGTTRDLIEDTLWLGQYRFRFTDTAGLRDTTDVIEALGVERAKKKLQEAAIVLYLADGVANTPASLDQELTALKAELAASGASPELLIVANKADEVTESNKTAITTQLPTTIWISAKAGTGIENLKAKLLETVDAKLPARTDIIVSNVRHHQALLQTQQALEKALAGLHNGNTGDFLALDIRHALYHLGEITGQISADDLLGNIFSKFCIGK